MKNDEATDAALENSGNSESSKLGRREVLGLATAGIATGLSTRLFAAQTAGDMNLAAIVTINGRKLEYRADQGQDLGDFVGEHFIQRCVRVARPDTALTAFFRPDRTSDRVEVVFELGRMFGAMNRKPEHLGQYHVEIKRGAVTIAEVDVPNHWWFSRWRWQSAPRPVIKSPEQLAAARLILPYSKTVAAMAEVPRLSDFVYRAPMDNAGVQVEMDSTGDRNDIGPTTEFQALYLTTGEPQALRALLAQAEAAGSEPTHKRDETTGAPVDFFQHPKLSWYGGGPQGKDWVDPGWSRDASGKLLCPWILNAAHDPALSYVPFLLTGDPYFLEELQFQGNETLGWTNYNRSVGHQIVNPSQTRTFSWSLRSIFQLARVTPNATPRWLKPRAYWKHILDDNLAYFSDTFVNNKVARSSTVFHAATLLNAIAGWQEDFLATVIGWGVRMGFEEWRPAYLWKLQATLARTNGKSGWPRQWCSPYYYLIAKNLDDPTYDPRSVPPTAWFKDWAAAWEEFRSNKGNHVVEPFTDDVSWQQSNAIDYLLYTRGCLALAVSLGVTEAQEPFEFVNRMTVRKGHMTYRWAIGT